MNTRIRCAFALACFMAASVLTTAAENKPPPKEEKKPLRVLSGPDRPSRMGREGERREPVEMETVAFLGVETAPVSPTTAAQLGLPRGNGLVVNQIVPSSPAAGVLQQHDILLRLDDQILIETRQFSVLIRNRKEGDEVELTYLRGGQKASTKIKLGKTDVPKAARGFGLEGLPFRTAPLREQFDNFIYRPDAAEERADVDRVLSLMQRQPGGEPMRIQVDRNRGPGFRAVAVHTGNSNMIFSDDDGSLELTAKDGVRTLVAKSAGGDTLFSGPVNTPEERKAMPPEIRARLERLEGMHDITFRTDGDFKGGEVRVITPRGIALPPSQPRQPGTPRPVFY